MNRKAFRIRVSLYLGFKAPKLVEVKAYKRFRHGKVENVLFSLENHVIPDKLIKFINKKGLDAEGFVPIMPKEQSFILSEFSASGVRVEINL